MGEGVDRSKQLQPAAMERALAVLREYREVIDEHRVGAVAMVGTSALRDASNRRAFSQAARTVMRVPLQLLPGPEEAVLSFAGATATLQGGPWLVADIGGGSTELALGPSPFEAVSLDLGSVRVAERFFADDPPAPEQLVAARAWLVCRLEEAIGNLPSHKAAATLVGLAGTVSCPCGLPWPPNSGLGLLPR